MARATSLTISIDYTPALTQRAGIGRFTRELVGALLDLPSPHRYLLISARNGDSAEVPQREGVRYHRLPLPERPLLILWHRLRLPLPLEALTGPLDLYHSPNYLLPPLRCSRAVVTVHDLSFRRFPECFRPETVRFLDRAVPRAAHRADLVLADSESSRADAIELLGLPPERVEVVYGGVDARFRPVADSAALAAVRTRYAVPGPFILTVGTLQPRKNLGRVFAAFARLRAERRLPHVLAIAGARGWQEAPLFAEVERLRLGDAVRFLGFVPDDDLPALLSAADAFAFPSLYEGFGLPALEALACGTPVAASNTSSLPEVVGDAGLLLDPSDTDSWVDGLARLVEDTALRQELRRRGFDQAARFTWRAAAEKLLGLYERVGHA